MAFPSRLFNCACLLACICLFLGSRHIPSCCFWSSESTYSGMKSASMSARFLDVARRNGNMQYWFHYGKIRLGLPVSIDAYLVSQQGAQESVSTAIKTNAHTRKRGSHGSPNFSTTFSRRQVALRPILKQLEILDGKNKWCLWESSCYGWMDGWMEVLTFCSTVWLVCTRFTNKCLAVPACFAGSFFLACWNPIILRFFICM